MEFFIPSLFIFLLAIIVSFIFIPRFTPLIAAILSIAFLTFGVYHHHKMFASEYRLSTWQDGLKIYAPAIMIGAIILFIVYSILSFFSGGSVPVPQIPNISSPNGSVANTLTNATESIGDIMNDMKDTVSDTMSNAVNTIKNTVANTNKGVNKNNGANRNKGNNLTKSLLEVL
jgi:predicted PurR-regulated permease PerM